MENLTFLLFRDLGAPSFLCGVSVVVTVLFEVPLSKSKALLERVGIPGLLSVAGVCYSFRVVGYTVCPNGWYVLLFEPMHGVTIAAWSTASVEVMASITPPAFTATGQAFLNLIRTGLGCTLGTSVGGEIIRTYGENACYRTSVVVVLLGFSIYHAGLWTPKNSLELVPETDPAVEQEEDANQPACFGRSR